MKKRNSKIDTELVMYTEKLADIIIAWINALPPQKFNKSRKIKETLGNKLVEDIIDQVKLEKIAPETGMEKDKYLCFFINRWLHRYDYFDTINEAKPYVNLLIEKIKDISIPNSLKYQKDSEKELPEIRFNENVSAQQKTLESHEMNKLSSEISRWVNEQPVQYFLKNIKTVTKDLNQKFASRLQDPMNTSRKPIPNEIKGWLNEIIRPEHKRNIPALAETLKSRIDNLICDKNVIHEHQESNQIVDENLCCDENITDIFTVSLEKTAKGLIAKFVEHKYDSENFIAREACAQLIKRELQKLGALSKSDPNMSTDIEEHETSIEKLSKELQYIRIISDCFRKLPLQESFNETENSFRAEHVNTLAKIINDIDENKQELPPERDYNYHLTLKITEFFKTVHIPSQYENMMPVLVNDLVNNILAVQRLSPCCSTNTGVFDLTLSDYIEAYIRENDEEIFDDDLKLEACISRLFSEINTMTNKNSAACRTSCVPNNIANRYMSSNETITHFTLKMEYANEITNWLNNLPLLPLRNKAFQNQLVSMVNSLAEKMSESNRLTNKNPHTDIDRDLIDYVSNWICNLPLDPNKEIAFVVVIQQLINRMNRISNRNKEQKYRKKQEVTTYSIDKKTSSNVCKYPNSCRTKANISLQNRDPGTAIVEIIEEWCNNLPVKAENDSASKTLKQNVATKIYQKMGELNMNPKYFNNNILYEEMLSEEIGFQLHNLPQNNKLQNTMKELKENLLDIIMALRIEIRNKTTGIEYKHDLEKTIEMSMPYPVRPSNQPEDSPGFKIYKDRLATMFILENFDHGNDAVKLNNEKRIRTEIDKYFDNVQDKNSIPLTKDQIYNDLYSALYSVPFPSESSMVDEVEEIKTRCEIDKWFETLPLREATGVGELLKWDKILAMLAKRLHEFEKYDKNCDDKIHKEITKWLVKLPLLPHQTDNIDDFANDLQRRLKSSFSDRKHVPRDVNKSHKSIIDQSKSILNTDEVNLPPSESIYNQTSPIQKNKKPADIILDIVESWCYQLPLPANTSQEKEDVKIIKDDLIVKIIMKISEINTNPETFNDDFLYNTLLDVELENLMAELPASYELNHSKDHRKNQLKEAIISVKPLIIDEKAMYAYKIEIKNTIDKILKDPFDKNTEKNILFSNLKEEIADHFIIYNFYKFDEDSNWKYKNLFNCSVEKYFTLLDSNKDESIDVHRDTLPQTNQLLCELSKIPTPGESSILEEIQEIEIKFELTKLFDNLSLSQDEDNLALKNQIKVSLAKQLNEIIKEGNACDNYNEIKQYVTMTLKKLDENIDLQIVDTFFKRLQHYISKNNTKNYSLFYKDVEKQKILGQNDVPNEKARENQWFSLLPETPKSSDHRDHYYNEPLKFDEYEKRGFANPQEARQRIESRFNNSGTSYEDFAKGSFLSSSIKTDTDAQVKTKPNGQSKACRRPSITFSPTESSIPDEKDQSSQKNSTSNERVSEKILDDACECLNKKKRPNVCSAHMQRHCRICNGMNPLHSRMPPFRYPSFYYH
ncbi:uncharacterized protein LOC135194220 [Vanessa tameamea]|uniref:Uncharacterized protein LOC135194220 n=1 Tax=Vanessa tameamea TaxID=334116 RepID=A0ABM4AVZ6_VANTA